MKKSIIINTGLLLLVAFLAGILFKVMHWPGASILMVSSMFLICFVFLPMAFINHYRGIGKKHRVLHILAYLVVVIDFTGMVFKVMHWPGAQWFMIVGIPLPFVVFLPVLLYHHLVKKSVSLKAFLSVSLLMIYVAVFSVLLSLSVSKETLTGTVLYAEKVDQNHDAVAEMADQLYNRVKQHHPGKKKQWNDIHEQALALTQQIESVKEQIILLENKDNASHIAADGNIDYRQLRYLNNSRSSNEILFKQKKLKALKAGIDDLQQEMQKLDKLSAPAQEAVGILLSTSDIKAWHNQMLPWEYFVTLRTELIWSLQTLSQLQENIKLAEAIIWQDMLLSHSQAPSEVKVENFKSPEPSSHGLKRSSALAGGLISLTWVFLGIFK